MPARALTSAMPAPMKPAPMIATFLIGSAGTAAGRRASLFSSCMEMNSERIIAAASLLCRTFAK